MSSLTVLVICVSFFFCKQKTAYEMRISDWSSDVCSSDLERRSVAGHRRVRCGDQVVFDDESADPAVAEDVGDLVGGEHEVDRHEIGRASCRERVCQYV